MTQARSRAELLLRRPDIYLADGYLDPTGQPWPALLGSDATAAATQLLAMDVAPQELGFTLAALSLLLPQQGDPTPSAAVQATIGEALRTVARAIQQPNNPGLVTWLLACAAPVASAADAAAFMAHLSAVDRQYTLIVALQPPAGSPPQPPPPG